MPEHMERITMNLDGMVRHDSMEGQEYLVVPMIMITEGVLDGSEGPLYYPESELAKTPAVWNHKPIVVYHPPEGQSACDPDIITNRKVGVIMHTEYEAGKLRAEAWLSKSRITTVDPRIEDAITNQTVMELSTGLFTDNEAVSGEFGGKEYTAIARNYRPDHLALLPDKIGACSVAAGAGFMRLNQALAKAPESILTAVNDLLKAAGVDATVGNELAHGDLYRLLSDTVEEPSSSVVSPAPYTYVSDIFDTYFIYEKKESLFRQSYSKVNDEITLVGDPVEVQKRVEFVPITNGGKNQMDKTKLIEKIIANTGFGESDAEYLGGLEVEALEKMLPIENDEAPSGKTPEADPVVETPEIPATNEQPVTVNEYIDNAPAEMQDVLRSGLAAHNSQKEALVASIVANERNTFKPEYLASRPLAELQAIASLATKPATQNSGSIFLGQGDPIVTENAEEPLSLPVMNFGTE